jgi:hypothetical protein
VGVVHGLERDARVIAVEVAVLHKVLDGIDDLFAVRTAGTTLSCANAPFSEHWPGVVLPRALWNVSVVHSVHRAACTFDCELKLREYDNADKGIQSVVVEETIVMEAIATWRGERESGWRTRRPRANSAQSIKCRQDIALCARVIPEYSGQTRCVTSESRGPAWS